MKKCINANWSKQNDVLLAEQKRFLAQKAKIWSECFDRYTETADRDESFKAAVDGFHKTELDKVKSSMRNMMKEFRAKVDEDTEHFRSEMQKQKAALFFRAVAAQRDMDEMRRRVDTNMRVIGAKKRSLTRVQSEIVAGRESARRSEAEHKGTAEKMATRIAQLNASVSLWSRTIDTDELLNVNKVVSC